MLDAAKDFFAPKSFGLVGYAFLIVQFLCGLALIGVISELRKSEFEKFSCPVGKQSTTAYKTYVEKTCYASYEQTYSRLLPLYGFALLSTGLIIFVSLVYSLGVRGHVEGIDNILKQSDASRNVEESKSSLPEFYVFYFYTLQLLLRFLFGILFTVLQYKIFFPRGFEFEFSCKLPRSHIKPQTGNKSSIGKLNGTSISVACQNLVATEKQFWGFVVSVLNCVFVLITLGELIYLISRRFTISNSCSVVRWETDTDFIIDYLLRYKGLRRYVPQIAIIENSIPLLCDTQNDNSAAVTDTPSKETAVSSPSDVNTANSSAADINIDSSSAHHSILDLDYGTSADYIANSSRGKESTEEQCGTNRVVNATSENYVGDSSITDTIGSPDNTCTEESTSNNITDNNLSDNSPDCIMPDNNAEGTSSSDNITETGTEGSGSVVDNVIPDKNTGGIGTSGSNNGHNSAQHNATDNCRFEKLISISKQKGLSQPCSPYICYAPNVDLNDMYIDLVIHTGRAPHKFSKKVDRHEIYDVYMDVPISSMRLKEIKDLFYPNKDTKHKFPRTILVVGRPGIGKTVLTEKVIRDWATDKVDEFYLGKIAFFFKFRWFNLEELKNLSFSKFLCYGMGLGEEKFEVILAEILKEPQKAIFIFDGLDEFSGDLQICLEQTRMLPNDLNTDMSAMTLFIKLAYGNLLSGATVLVTSRPTADHFYSKLNFDRNVEVLGFTSDKIEEYVSRFCDNIERRDLQSKIWNHVNSSSDLLNLCYIPVNCFIICVTLSECLSDSNNDTGALPTTLTKLYNTAIDHFAEQHYRICDDKPSSEQTLANLQKLAFKGVKNGQLVFNKKGFDEQMKKSGLVNSLSNPIFPVQTQYCFIHLTIQEFLAARHVTESLSLGEIEHFIATHIKSGTWHLVLQFIAGLLSEKIKMGGSDYCGCGTALTKGLTLENGTIDLDTYGTMHVIKCLREVDEEKFVKEVCDKTDFNIVTSIYASSQLSASDWAALASVCKHLKNMTHFKGDQSIANDNCFIEFANLLQQTCLERLVLSNNFFPGNEQAQKQLINALMESKCALKHEHRNLTHLSISLKNMTDACVSEICSLIENGHVRHLKYLSLASNSILESGISKLCKVLNDTNCKELTSIDLSGNPLDVGGVRTLCNVLKRGQLSKLNELSLKNCSLTKECMPYLCETLRDEHCKLNYLTLATNDIGDEGLHTLCTGAFKNEQCKLTRLNAGKCSLTDGCVEYLGETLKDVNCKLMEILLTKNDFTAQGKAMLCDVEKTGSCKVHV